MSDLEARELERLAHQARLDAAIDPKTRNQRGQYATPRALAEAICATLSAPDAPVRVLEPAAGTGAFVSALLRGGALGPNATLHAVEFDPQVAQLAGALWTSDRVTVQRADFTRLTPPQTPSARYDWIVANPPYVRHHHLDPEDKRRIKRAAEHASGLALSGLSGLYAHFMALSMAWWRPGGRAVWLVPSEVLDVRYGEPLRRCWTQTVTLERAHCFAPEDEGLFEGAIVSSCVLWLRNAPPPKDHRVRWTWGARLDQPARERWVPLASMDPERHWSPYASRPEPSGARGAEVVDDGVPLGEVFKVRRGVATGANRFFVMERAEVEARGIPARFATPVLPSPRYVQATRLEADVDGYPIGCPQRALLTCDAPPDAVRAQWPKLWAYLKQGRAEGVHEGYLCSRRTPWYRQESREAPLLFCPYMGRRKRADGGAPFRFILNRSRAVATNVYLMLYPNAALRSWLDAAPERDVQVAETLWSLPPSALWGEGRVYGGGLGKLEPGELVRVRLPREAAWVQAAMER